MTRYVISEVTMYDHLHKLIDLPPGHHHVHVGEDGTITAVPMRLWGTDYNEPWLWADIRPWVDAPGEPA